MNIVQVMRELLYWLSHPLGSGAFNPRNSLKYFSIQISILSRIFIFGLPLSGSTPS